MDKTAEEQIKDFSKCVNALALELPEQVWSEVNLRWCKLVDALTASQSAGQGSEGVYSEADLYEAYNDGCNEGMSAAGAFEWGTRRKDISFQDWLKDFVPSKPLPVSPSKPTHQNNKTMENENYETLF